MFLPNYSCFVLCDHKSGLQSCLYQSVPNVWLSLVY
nr:MAG TPA: hypothetical protein [Caudoviricetes sp.]